MAGKADRVARKKRGFFFREKLWPRLSPRRGACAAAKGVWVARGRRRIAPQSHPSHTRATSHVVALCPPATADNCCFCAPTGGTSLLPPPPPLLLLRALCTAFRPRRASFLLLLLLLCLLLRLACNIFRPLFSLRTCCSSSGQLPPPPPSRRPLSPTPRASPRHVRAAQFSAPRLPGKVTGLLLCEREYIRESSSSSVQRIKQYTYIFRRYM